MNEPKRFWSKVGTREVSECWEWLASRGSAGYGQFWIHEKIWGAHRVAWTLTYGPIPEGLGVCHHCDNPGCCNPYHLFLGTQADNLADAARKGHLPSRGNPKLTEDDILTIRELYAIDEWTQEELAEEFGVHKTTITRIVTRKAWRHI